MDDFSIRPSENGLACLNGVLVSGSMKWLKVSFVIQIILAVYFQAMLWFPLGSCFTHSDLTVEATQELPLAAQ